MCDPSIGVADPHDPQVMSHSVPVASPAAGVAVPLEPSSPDQTTLSAAKVVSTLSVTEVLFGSMVVFGAAGLVCVIDLIAGPRPPVGFAMSSDWTTHAVPTPLVAPPLDVCFAF